jgi:hypothetical protein
MTKKRIFLTLLVLALPLLVSAQGVTGGFTVDSNPPGALVTIDGALILTGVTPVLFNQGLDGKFKIRVEKHGYESYKSSVFLQSGKATTLNIRLKAKTRFKAASRSLLIPGWGQMYGGQKFKGVMFLLLTAGGVASYLIADADFDDKQDEYDRLNDDYRNAGTYAEKERLYPMLSAAKKDAYDAENLRRITIGATIGIWGLSLLDALLFFPEERGSFLVDQISIEPDLEQGGGKIVLSSRF